MGLLGALLDALGLRAGGRSGGVHARHRRPDVGSTGLVEPETGAGLAEHAGLLAAIEGQDPAGRRARFVEDVIAIAGISRVGGRSAGRDRRALPRARRKPVGGMPGGERARAAPLPRHFRRSRRRRRRRCATLAARRRARSWPPRSTPSTSAPASWRRAASTCRRSLSPPNSPAISTTTRASFSRSATAQRPDDQPVVGGGRYDRLLQHLGAPDADSRRRLLDLARPPRAPEPALMTGDRDGRPLILAVPSKGRLQENAAAFFAPRRPALTQARGVRDYRGALARRRRCRGAVPVGRRDRRRSWPRAARISASPARTWCARDRRRRRSGRAAGAARLRPRQRRRRRAAGLDRRAHAWPISTRSRSDLRARHGTQDAGRDQIREPDPRASSREHGIGDYRIVESLGATEGAPASGAGRAHRRHHHDRRDARRQRAEGARRRRHPALARPISSPRSRRPGANGARERAPRTVLARIAAEEEARTTREVRAALDRRPCDRDRCARATVRCDAAARAATAAKSSCIARNESVFGLVEALLARGASDVTVRTLAYVFQATNPLGERLFKRLV